MARRSVNDGRSTNASPTPSGLAPTVWSACRSWVSWFVCLWLLLLTWSVTIGRYGGPDEPAHVTRAYAVAHADLLGTPTDDFTSGYRIVTVPGRLGSGDPACYRFDPTATDACAAASDLLADVRVASAAGINPPLYYALVGVPVRILLPADELLSYRIVAAAWVAAVLAFAARRLARHGSRGLVGLAVLAPSAWFLFGVVNPNSLEIALAALAWAYVTPTASRLSTSDWAVAGSAMAVAIAIRPIAVVAALVIGAVGWCLDASNGGRRGLPRSFLAFAAPMVFAAVSVTAWHGWADVTVSDPRTATERSVVGSLLASLGGLPRTGAELVGSLGWLEFWVPLVAVAGWTVLVVALVARSRPRGTPLAIWTVGLVGTPVLFEVVMADEIGLIWQGRYSLPVFVGLAALVLSSSRPWSLPRPTLAVVAGVEVMTFVCATRRYAVGTDGPWWPTRDSMLVIGAHLSVVTLGCIAISRWVGRTSAASGSAEVAEHVDDHV